MMRQEIKHCMRDLTLAGNGEFSARFAFPLGFSGFKGHFPDNPVLPGLCTIQAALVMLEASRKQPSTLREIVSAKFFSAVHPSMELEFKCREIPQPSGLVALKTTVTSQSRKIAEMSLKIAYGPRKE